MFKVQGGKDTTANDANKPSYSYLETTLETPKNLGLQINTPTAIHFHVLIHSGSLGLSVSVIFHPSGRYWSFEKLSRCEERWQLRAKCIDSGTRRDVEIKSS
jgi:hypothetical protein